MCARMCLCVFVLPVLLAEYKIEYDPRHQLAGTSMLPHAQHEPNSNAAVWDTGKGSTFQDALHNRHSYKRSLKNGVQIGAHVDLSHLAMIASESAVGFGRWEVPKTSQGTWRNADFEEKK